MEAERLIARVAQATRVDWPRSRLLGGPQGPATHEAIDTGGGAFRGLSPNTVSDSELLQTDAAARRTVYAEFSRWLERHPTYLGQRARVARGNLAENFHLTGIHDSGYRLMLLSLVLAKIVLVSAAPHLGINAWSGGDILAVLVAFSYGIPRTVSSYAGSSTEMGHWIEAEFRHHNIRMSPHEVVRRQRAGEEAFRPGLIGRVRDTVVNNAILVAFIAASVFRRSSPNPVAAIRPPATDVANPEHALVPGEVPVVSLQDTGSVTVVLEPAENPPASSAQAVVADESTRVRVVNGDPDPVVEFALQVVEGRPDVESVVPALKQAVCVPGMVELATVEVKNRT